MGHRIELLFDDHGALVDIRNEPWSPEPPAPLPQSLDALQDRDALVTLLKTNCDIQSPEWIVNRYDPGRIILVACKALWAKKHGKLTHPSPRPLILHLLQTGKDVDDHRTEILRDLERGGERGGSSQIQLYQPKRP